MIKWIFGILEYIGAGLISSYIFQLEGGEMWIVAILLIIAWKLMEINDKMDEYTKKMGMDDDES